MKRHSGAMAGRGGDDDDDDSIPEKVQGVRYINDDMIMKVSGQRNLALITELDLTLSKEGGKKIRYIENLSKLKKLQVLSLSHNLIEKIEKLDSLTKLRELNLSFNRLTKIEGLETLVSLQILNLNGNLIQIIPSWLPKKLKALRALKLAKNSIESLEELRKLRSLANLTQLICSENPVSELAHCRPYLIFHLRSLEVLDGQKVHARDRVDADERFAQEEIEELQTQLLDMERKYDALAEEHNRSLDDIRTSHDKESALRQLQINESERIKQLEAEVEAKNELLKKKSSELSKACQKHYQLEQELAFFKIDSKFSKLGEKPPSPEPEDTEVSLIAESPYIGRAKYTTNAFAHERMVPHGGRQLQLREPRDDSIDARGGMRRPLGQLEGGTMSMDYELEIVGRRKAIEDAESKLNGLQQTLSATESQIVFAVEQLLQLTAASGNNRALTEPEKQALRLQLNKKMATISDLRAKAQKVNAMLNRIDEEKEALGEQVTKADEELSGMDSSHPRYSELASARDERLSEARSARAAGDQLRGELDRLGELLRKEMHSAHVLEQQLLHGQVLPADSDMAAAKHDLAAIVASLRNYLGRRHGDTSLPAAGSDHEAVENELRSQRDVLAKKVAQLESEMSVLDAEASENNDLRKMMSQLQQSLAKEKTANEELQQKLNDTVTADADLSVHLRETQDEVERLQRELDNARKEASDAQNKSSQSRVSSSSLALRQLKEENKKLGTKLEQREAELKARLQAAESLLQPDTVQAKLRTLLNNIEMKKLPPTAVLKEPLDKACADLQISLVEKIKKSEADAAEAKKQAEKMVADAEEVKSARVRQLEMEMGRERRAFEAKEAAAANEIRQLRALLQQAEQSKAHSSDTDGMSLVDEMRSELGDLRKQLYDKQNASMQQLAEAQSEIEQLKQLLAAERQKAQADGQRRRPADPVLFQDQQPRRNQLSPSKRPVRPPFNEADSSDSSAWPAAGGPLSRESARPSLPPGLDDWHTDDEAQQPLQPHGPYNRNGRNDRVPRNRDRQAAQLAADLQRANDEVARLRELLNERERLLNEEATHADRSDAAIEAQKEELDRLQALLQEQEDEIDRLNSIISHLLSSRDPSATSGQPPAADYVTTIADIQDRLDELKDMIEPQRGRAPLLASSAPVPKGRSILAAGGSPRSPMFMPGVSFRPGSDNVLPNWKAKSHDQPGGGIVTSTPHADRGLSQPRAQRPPAVMPNGITRHHSHGNQRFPHNAPYAGDDRGRVIDHQHQTYSPHDSRHASTGLNQTWQGAALPPVVEMHGSQQNPAQYCPHHYPGTAMIAGAPSSLLCAEHSEQHAAAQPMSAARLEHAQLVAAAAPYAEGYGYTCAVCAELARTGKKLKLEHGAAGLPVHTPASAAQSCGNVSQAQPASAAPVQTAAGTLPHVILLPPPGVGQLSGIVPGNQTTAGHTLLADGRANAATASGSCGVFCNVQGHHHLEDEIANLHIQMNKMKARQHKAKKRLAELGAVQSLQRELEKRQHDLESLSATVEEHTSEMHRLRDVETELLARKEHLQQELSTLRHGNSGDSKTRAGRSARGNRTAHNEEEKHVSETSTSSLRESEAEQLRARECFLQDEICCIEETISKRRAELRAADRRLHACQGDLEMAKQEALATVLTYDEAQLELNAAASEAADLRQSAVEARADLVELTEKLHELDEQKLEKEQLLQSIESMLQQRDVQFQEIEAALHAASARLHVLEEECKVKEQQCRDAERVTSQAQDTGEMLNRRLHDMEQLEAKIKAKRADLQTVTQSLAQARSDFEAAVARAAQERLSLDELTADGARLRSETQDKRRLLEGLQQKQEELEGNIRNQEGQLEHLTSTVAQQQHLLNDAVADLQQKRDELHVLQDDLSGAQLEADEARHAVTSLNAQIDRAKLQLEMTEKQLAELAALCDGRQAECARFEAAIKERSEALRSLATEKDSMERSLAATGSERDRLQSACSTLQEKAADLKRAQHAREESLRAAEHDLQQLQQQRAAVSEELDQAAQRKAAGTRELALLEQQTKDQKADQVRLKKQAVDTEERLKRLEKEAASLQASVETKNAVLQQILAEEQVLRHAYADTRIQLDSYREAASAAERQLRQLEADKSERQRGLEQLVEELARQHERLSESRADGERRLEMVNREVAAKRSALQSITTECAEVSEQLATKMKAVTQVQDLESRLASLSSERAHLLGEHERLVSAAAGMQQQLENLHDRLQKNARISADAATLHRRQLDELHAELRSVKQRSADQVESLEAAAQGHSRRADRLLSELGEARLELQQLQAKLRLQEELAAKDKRLEATLETIKSEIQTEVAHGLTELERSRTEAAMQLSDLQLQKSQVEQHLESLKENAVRAAPRLSIDGNTWSAFDKESAAKREALRERFLVEQSQLRDKLFEQMSRHISSLERARSQSDTVLSSLQKKVIDLEGVLNSNTLHGTDAVPTRLSGGRGSYD